MTAQLLVNWGTQLPVAGWHDRFLGGRRCRPVMLRPAQRGRATIPETVLPPPRAGAHMDACDWHEWCECDGVIDRCFGCCCCWCCCCCCWRWRTSLMRRRGPPRSALQAATSSRISSALCLHGPNLRTGA